MSLNKQSMQILKPSLTFGNSKPITYFCLYWHLKPSYGKSNTKANAFGTPKNKTTDFVNKVNKNNQ